MPKTTKKTPTFDARLRAISRGFDQAVKGATPYETAVLLDYALFTTWLATYDVNVPPTPDAVRAALQGVRATVKGARVAVEALRDAVATQDQG